MHELIYQPSVGKLSKLLSIIFGFFSVTKLKEVSTSQAPDGSIDCVQLNLKIEDVLKKKDNDHSLLIQKRDLGELLGELKKARSFMETT